MSLTPLYSLKYAIYIHINQHRFIKSRLFHIQVGMEMKDCLLVEFEFNRVESTTGEVIESKSGEITFKFWIKGSRFDLIDGQFPSIPTYLKVSKHTGFG